MHTGQGSAAAETRACASHKGRIQAPDARRKPPPRRRLGPPRLSASARHGQPWQRPVLPEGPQPAALCGEAQQRRPLPTPAGRPPHSHLVLRAVRARAPPAKCRGCEPTQDRACMLGFGAFALAGPWGRYGPGTWWHCRAGTRTPQKPMKQQQSARSRSWI